MLRTLKHDDSYASYFTRSPPRRLSIAYSATLSGSTRDSIHHSPLPVCGNGAFSATLPPLRLPDSEPSYFPATGEPSVSSTYCDFIVIYLARSEVPETHPRDSAIAALLTLSRLDWWLNWLLLFSPALQLHPQRVWVTGRISSVCPLLCALSAPMWLPKFSGASIALLWIPADMIRH